METAQFLVCSFQNAKQLASRECSVPESHAGNHDTLRGNGYNDRRH